MRGKIMRSARRMTGMLLIAVLLCVGIFTGTATAVTVSVVPSKNVGLDDAGYYSGIVTLNIDGTEYMAMSSNGNLSAFYPSWYTDSTQFQANLYTYDDILAGGTSVLFTSDAYSRAAGVFQTALLGYDPPDPLWAAGLGECIWNAAYGSTWYDYATRDYDGSGTTMLDVYKSLTLDDNEDYSDYMWVLSDPNISFRELLVFSTPVSVPEPISLVLVGTGLIGIIVRARKK